MDKKPGATTRRASGIVTAALLGLAVVGAPVAGRAADPQPPNHSGSAQPFVGFHKLDPIVMRNGNGRLMIEPFVRFRENLRPTIEGTGPNAFSSASQALATALIRHRLVLLWLDRGNGLGREDVTRVITETIDEVTRIEGVESVSYTRFSVR